MNNNLIKAIEITLSKENLIEQMQDTIVIADSFTNKVRKAHSFRCGMDSTIINYNNVYINS